MVRLVVGFRVAGWDAWPTGGRSTERVSDGDSDKKETRRSTEGRSAWGVEAAEKSEEYRCDGESEPAVRWGDCCCELLCEVGSDVAKESGGPPSDRGDTGGHGARPSRLSHDKRECRKWCRIVQIVKKCSGRRHCRSAAMMMGQTSSGMTSSPASWGSISTPTAAYTLSTRVCSK